MRQEATCFFWGWVKGDLTLLFHVEYETGDQTGGEAMRQTS